MAPAWAAGVWVEAGPVVFFCAVRVVEALGGKAAAFWPTQAARERMQRVGLGGLLQLQTALSLGGGFCNFESAGLHLHDVLC